AAGAWRRRGSTMIRGGPRRPAGGARRSPRPGSPVRQWMSWDLRSEARRTPRAAGTPTAGECTARPLPTCLRSVFPRVDAAPAARRRGGRSGRSSPEQRDRPDQDHRRDDRDDARAAPWGATAPSPRARLAWKSRVENTVAADPLVGSSAISDRPALGGWLLEASAGGGSTHRYNGGGASPSRMGRRDEGPSEALTTAPAR